jgi:hypothetical protein
MIGAILSNCFGRKSSNVMFFESSTFQTTVSGPSKIVRLMTSVRATCGP